MSFNLVWLPDVLLNAGLKVARVDGWADRGRGNMGPIRGVMCHHTGGLPPGTGTMTSLNTLIKGRPDLTGPLAHLGLGRDGTYYLVAAGRANHAGPGEWKGRREGNSGFVGIEAENSGLPSDIWPEVQMDAYARGVAAILRRIGVGADQCIAHREWAPARKVDPRFDITMDAFRRRVQAMITGSAAPRPLIPAVAEVGGKELPTLRRDALHDLVGWLQEKLQVSGNRNFDALTEAAVRRFQRDHGLVDDGIVGPKTWTELEASFGLAIV